MEKDCRKFYKYTDQKGAYAIIENQNLLFKHPSAMNDPFDILIEDLYGTNLDEVHRDSGKELMQTLIDDPDYFVKEYNINTDDARKFSEKIKSLSEKERTNFEVILKYLEAQDTHLAKLRAEMERGLNAFVNNHKTLAIFCATQKNDSLLMWAHYAEQHRGAVLGFTPNIKKDSFLRLLRPVSYASERPQLLEKHHKKSSEENLTGLELAAHATNKIWYTKSSEWEYEQELRLVIPYQIPPNTTESLIRYEASELTEVYLGWKMPQTTQIEISELAKKRNPNIRIFLAKPEFRKYSIVFHEL